MRTDQQIYMAIAEVVNRTAPADWQTIIVSASIQDDNGETGYDYLDSAGNKNWFFPENFEQYEVYKAFKELRTLMKSSSHAWDTARFTLERSGSFGIEFDYKE